MNKLQNFEYIVSRFIVEYSNSTWKELELVKDWNNDLSILKLQKLLFFLSTKNTKLLNIFSFYALPYWPVELETYKKYEKLNNVKISNRFSKIVTSVNTSVYDSEFTSQVEVGIESLKQENPSIFRLGAFDLVHISHKWDCWKNNESIRGAITKEDIASSVHYYK